MGYHPRIESSDLASFLTTRSRGSALWFVNNEPLTNAILGYAAKYSERYDVKLYALAVEGNHVQCPALFPRANRAAFMRDFNSSVARAVDRHTPEYEGGRFWARRYSQEFLPNYEDVEEYFWYTVLQPVQDGLVEKISDYPGYNCFHDAVSGIARSQRVVRWAAYNDARRYNQNVSIVDFTEVVHLKYERLPGYEDLSQQEYKKLMYEKLHERQNEIVEARYASGKRFAGRKLLLKIPRGSMPGNTKRSGRYSHRPRILSICNITRAEFKSWYFEIYFEYKEASRKYRQGDEGVAFPIGTYPPWRPAVYLERKAA